MTNKVIYTITTTNSGSYSIDIRGGFQTNSLNNGSLTNNIYKEILYGEPNN